MVQRVEIVRGGGSALFGASAIGGTINIITKEPSENSADVAHTITGATNGSTAFDNNTTGNLSVVTTNNRAGFYLYGQSRHRAAYDRDGDGYTDLPTLDNKTVGLSSFFRLTDYAKITLKYHGLKEYRRGGNKLYLPAHEANIAEQIDIPSTAEVWATTSLALMVRDISVLMPRFKTLTVRVITADWANWPRCRWT